MNTLDKIGVEVEENIEEMDKQVQDYEDILFAKKRKKQMDYWISLIAKWDDNKFLVFLQTPEKRKLIEGHEEEIKEARRVYKWAKKLE